jgi:hypothetical protein
MSLKTFHILFITVAALLAFGFAWWLLNADPTTTGALAGGVLSALVGAGLIVYGIRFLKKLKHVSYL